MVINKLLATLLLLSVFAAPTTAQTPVNHLIAILQASKEQLQLAAQHSSAQQAYSTVIQIVDRIFGAMQKMSLPYYQNQLQFLTRQQISLSNRLAALQSSITSNANMLFRMTSQVSSSLAAQTANVGSVVLNYQNTVAPQISQLETDINGLTDLLPGLVTQVGTIADKSKALVTKADEVAAKLNEISDKVAEYINEAPLYWTTVIDVPDSLPAASAPNCVAMNIPLNRPYDAPPRVVIHAYGLLTGTPELALDPVMIALTDSAIDLWLCDRTRTTFTHIPTRLFIEVVDMAVV